MSQIVYESNAQVTQATDLIFKLNQPDSILAYAAVIVPAHMVNTLYHQVSLSQKSYAQTHGFVKGNVPLEYITQNFMTNLTEHIKEFLFKYFVIGFLLEQIHKNKLLVIGDPRLVDIHLQPNQDAQFSFELSTFEPLTVQEWKYLPFKAPKRKNYKDLDRQVDSFIEEEKKFLNDTQPSTLAIGDWVHFDLWLSSPEQSHLLGDKRTSLWLKLGDEEADTFLHEIFVGKSAGAIFTTQNKGLQEYFSTQIDTNYLFTVHIQDVLKNSFFCLDQFKRYFKLKTNKELYQKLIEVFSYRNDLSLRRSMAEESLKLLLSKHRINVPNYLILRQQKSILDKIKQNPDYHVYRAQKDFQDRIKQLAEKQIRETMFLDQLAYQEDLDVNPGDIKSYLNFTNRQRMKDFLYFDAPVTKYAGQEVPFNQESLKRFYLREKTLNHIIYHLTKK